MLESPLVTVPPQTETNAIAVKAVAFSVPVKSPAAVQFVRNRMLYARPVLNSRGIVTFGLRHIRKSNGIKCFGPNAKQSRCPEPLPFSAEK